MKNFFTKGSLLGLLLATFAVTTSLAFAASHTESASNLQVSGQQNLQARLAHHQEMREEHEKIKTAIENDDYAAFQAAVANSPMEAKIDSEAKFNQLVEAKELKESGDIQGAIAIMTELGVRPPHRHNRHMMGHGKIKAGLQAGIENGDDEASQGLMIHSRFEGDTDAE